MRFAKIVHQKTSRVFTRLPEPVKPYLALPGTATAAHDPMHGGRGPLGGNGKPLARHAKWAQVPVNGPLQRTGARHPECFIEDQFSWISGLECLQPPLRVFRDPDFRRPDRPAALVGTRDDIDVLPTAAPHSVTLTHPNTPRHAPRDRENGK